MINFQIYVPTWGRCGDTSTLSLLNEEQCCVVCRPSEQGYYRETGYPTLVLPEGMEGLGAARQYIVETADADYIWMVDDDLKLDNLYKSIEYITFNASLEKAGIFGLGQYFMSHERIKKDGIFTRRGASRQVWGLDRKRYLSSKLDMSKWILMQDLYCWMGMQIAGHRVLISNECLLKEGKGANYGGSVHYRNPERVRGMLMKLKETFPNYIEVFESYRGTVQGLPIGVNFRVKWAKIHQEIPRVD